MIFSDDYPGRQSLVTPIDWKQVPGPRRQGIRQHGRQSLVTPIDWKQWFSSSLKALSTLSPILGDAY